MKSVPAVLFAALFVVECISPVSTLVAQTGTQPGTAEVSGTLSLPAGKGGDRAFRGRLYRNRLSTESDKSSGGASVKSAFEDAIVSLHPTSFKADAKPLAQPAAINQQSATFVPRVTAVTQGSFVEFVNEDPFFHNVFSKTPGNEFNIGRRLTGEVVKRQLKKIEGLGEIKIFCDIHAQMSAIIVSFDTPYFTRVKASGEFSVKNLPAGNYTLRVYHPDFSGYTEKIEVKAGDALKRTVTLN